MKPAHSAVAAPEPTFTSTVRPLRRARNPRARRTTTSTRTPLRHKTHIAMRPGAEQSIIESSEPLQTALDTFLYIPRILFLETQFGLVDLLFMVALLGNSTGLTFSLISDTAAAATLAIPIGLVVFNGATWGLWIATCLSETRVLQRWWLMLLGTLCPLAVVGIPVCLGMVLISIHEEWECWIPVLCGLVILPTCLCLIIEALLLQRRVQRQEKAKSDGAEPAEKCHA